ncbi:class I SAM-dependent methyltransferase [Ginsengibacter hankyongi]|uniref:Class I SAM-dependent methyltransferase n=1 Tax=Ginsengibacter hankyongi TaxID=2607284 RepID=A0A5J5I9W9_9BACT|nr:class I SAM-dependent methyltransferase [Ginsengibacter hankyongi]KAA9034604.1 class I SAM-dependent methyltransferase [Ginsengibacter hankyongi]
MRKTIKQMGYRLLMSNKLSQSVAVKVSNIAFPGSAAYWENRYRKNGNSGVGSYGKSAAYKASVINKFAAENNIRKVIELGCGDGNQLKQFEFPLYLGLDVSATAIEKCVAIFKQDNSKRFYIYNETTFAANPELFTADLVLSLDVIYHLLEDEVYENYMQKLFSSSSRFVIIYAWDVDGKQKYHVRHRKFSEWIALYKKDWHLVKRITNNTALTCDFFIYEKVDSL